MNEIQYKRQYKGPACTSNPISHLIPPKDRSEVLRLIDIEIKTVIGYSLSECSNRLVCATGSKCIGRPLPVQSKLARPYIELLKQYETVIDDKLYLKTDCRQCPIVTSCSSLCNQVIDFCDRSKVLEPQLESLTSDLIYDTKDDFSEPSNLKFKLSDLPFDCITKKKQILVKSYIFDNKDFRQISDELNYFNQAEVKLIFYSTLTKMAEFASVRLFLKDKGSFLRIDQLNILNSLYIENKSLTKLAKELNTSPANISQIKSRILRKYNISWPVYIKKINNLPVYNVPEVLK